MKFQTAFKIIGAIFLISLWGCLSVDDQHQMTRSQYALVNPKPIARDFRQNNESHKVLIGIVDTGVDYNQPELLANMHFKLDASGQPIGLGWDFTGNDPWPAPYIARTTDVNSGADAIHKTTSANLRISFSRVVAKYPQLAEILNPDRAVEQEANLGYHGTHVAGLATQGNPAIGILPYRILINKKFNLATDDIEADEVKRVAGNIEVAVRKAIAGGARVINMSLALTDDAVEDHMAFQKAFVAFRRIVAENPNVVFVGAAGNSSRKGKVHYVKAGESLPCGIQAPNVLCVVAVDNHGKIADFSSVPDPSLQSIKAPGVDIRSTIPVNMCVSQILRLLNAEQVDAVSENNIPKFALTIASECALSVKTGYDVESGTSMSAPIVAHAAAVVLIDHPEFSGAQVIAELGKKFGDTVPFRHPFVVGLNQ